MKEKFKLKDNVLKVNTGGMILFGDWSFVHPKLVPFILTQKQWAAVNTNF